MTIIKQTPRQLHELHQIPEAMEYASIVHQYVELTQLWRTVGYRCKRCDIAFKNKNVLIIQDQILHSTVLVLVI